MSICRRATSILLTLSFAMFRVASITAGAERLHSVAALRCVHQYPGVYIGQILDRAAVRLHNSLIFLASPTGFEPVLPP
jgi:hypothetical protein